MAKHGDTAAAEGLLLVQERTAASSPWHLRTRQAQCTAASATGTCQTLPAVHRTLVSLLLVSLGTMTHAVMMRQADNDIWQAFEHVSPMPGRVEAK